MKIARRVRVPSTPQQLVQIARLGKSPQRVDLVLPAAQERTASRGGQILVYRALLGFKSILGTGGLVPTIADVTLILMF